MHIAIIKTDTGMGFQTGYGEFYSLIAYGAVVDGKLHKVFIPAEDIEAQDDEVLIEVLLALTEMDETP